MKFLLTADLHLTDNDYDAYRWDIFKWLKIKAATHKVDAIIIAGDLTDAKDEHSASLVSKIVAGLLYLTNEAPVHILKGNHDYANPDKPFFKFVNNMYGISYYSVPSHVRIAKKKFLFLPHDKDIATKIKKPEYAKVDRYPCEFLIFHQALQGATSNTGAEIRGLYPRDLKALCPEGLVIGGDIHKPQDVGGCVYAGSPYPINFNDDHKPRVLLYEDGKLESLYRYCPEKVSLEIDGPEDLPNDLIETSQVRIYYNLHESDFHLWDKKRTEVISILESRGYIVRSVTLQPKSYKLQKVADSKVSNEKVFERYCKDNDVTEDMEALGRGFLYV